MSAPLNQVQTNPSLKDLLDVFKKDIFLSLNSHAIATVQSFNSSAQTVTATINYQKTFYEDDGQGNYVPRLQNYPILVNVPIVILGGAGAALTFPLAKGDQCLILFNDRDIDNWVMGARSGGPATSRAHSLADGIALVGLNKVAAYNSQNVVLNAGDALINIMNDVTTLKTLLFELIAAINALTVTIPAVPTTPYGAPGTYTVSGIPGSVNSDIGDLLE